MTVLVKNVSCYYDTVCAVDDVSLEIQKGEIFFLLGPSGCGKTTLLRSVAGFEKAVGGSITVAGQDVTAVEPHKRNVGMVFQGYALWPHMTVAENISFGLVEKKVPAAEVESRVSEIMKMVRVDDLKCRKPNELSGGQQQRVALARTLVMRPDCLLLDEPLANLDARLRLEMRSEIRRLCKEFDMTAIYVTHDCKEALSIADKIAVMKDGKIVQAGSPEEIYTKPADLFVARFPGEVNCFDGKWDNDEITTSIGVFKVDNPGKNDGAKVVFRPESLIFVEKASDRVNSFNGTIRERMYLGEVVEYEIDVNGAVIRALEMNPAYIRERGSEVKLEIKAADIMLLS